MTTPAAVLIKMWDLPALAPRRVDLVRALMEDGHSAQDVDRVMLQMAIDGVIEEVTPDVGVTMPWRAAAMIQPALEGEEPREYHVTKAYQRFWKAMHGDGSPTSIPESPQEVSFAARMKARREGRS